MTKKDCPTTRAGQSFFYCSIFYILYSLSIVLFRRNVLVDILAADEGIEKDVEETDDWNDVGEQVAYVVGKHILEER